MSKGGELKGAEYARRAFEQKLKRAAEQIREEAKGRTCGTCLHYVGGVCPYVMPALDGYPGPHPPEAVACKRWQALPKPRATRPPVHPTPNRLP